MGRHEVIRQRFTEPSRLNCSPVPVHSFACQIAACPFLAEAKLPGQPGSLIIVAGRFGKAFERVEAEETYSFDAQRLQGTMHAGERGTPADAELEVVAQFPGTPGVNQVLQEFAISTLQSFGWNQLVAATHSVL